MTVRLVDSNGRSVGHARSRAAAHRRTRSAQGSHLRLVDNRAWGGRVLPREFYVPKSAKGRSPITIEDLEVYPYDEHVGGKSHYGAVVFAGKASKPLWHYWYTTPEARDKKIAETIASRRHVRKTKETEKTARREFKHDVKVGDIFDTSWGYDQTNVEFFQVVEVRGADVIVREIAQKGVGNPGGSSMSDNVVGIPDEFIGAPIRVRPQPGGGLKIEGHYASKWSGKPQYKSWYA